MKKTNAIALALFLVSALTALTPLLAATAEFASRPKDLGKEFITNAKYGVADVVDKNRWECYNYNVRN